MEYRALGPLEVLDGSGHKLPLGGVRQQTVLASLLLRAGETVGLERLVDELWEEPPATAARTIQAYVSRLRHLLPAGAIESRPGGFALLLNGARLDLHTFEQTAEEGRAALASGEHERAGQLLRQAFALWRGPALAGLTSDALRREAARLEELRYEVLEDRLEADLGCGREREIVPELQALVAEHPFRERPRSQLMLALYRAGRQTEALAAYQDARRTLVDELGVEPSAHLRELEKAILRQDASLVAEALPTGTVARISRRRSKQACAACGYEAARAFQFCPECGEEAAPSGREQRKVVTVLCCDVVGSTALGESVDPEALRALLAGYFTQMKEIVERHGGSVEKFIGDAVMAVFGVPVAHEDDAIRACRAAVEMRDAFPQLGVEGRIGLTTGEVVTGTEERLATGDALNVAARLQQTAQPGGVLIDETTHAVLLGAIEVESLEPFELKGKAQPVQAYRLLSLNETPPPRHEAPFVGREQELELIRVAWQRALVGQCCELVTVVGEAGVGKSRLVAEALAPLEARLVQGRCLPYGEGITYWPVVEILKQLGASPSDRAAAAAIGSVLGETDVATSAEEIAWAFRKLLEEEAPLIAVFDDIQWGEETFLDLLEHVALLSSGAAILLLGIARPELTERRAGWPVTLRLEPFVAEQAEELIPERITGGLRAKIARAGGGNPLFVEEMAAMAGEAGGGDVLVPPTLQALLAARLDQLDPAERKVLERGAVEGEVFNRGAVQALAADESQVTPRLASLVRKGLIRPEKSKLVGEDGFRFQHLLIRDAAYAGIPKGVRAELHQRFAAWLEERSAGRTELDEILGYHLERAGRYRGEVGLADDGELAAAARRRLAAAGRRALSRQDYGAAANLLERTVALVPEGEIDVPLELSLTGALVWGGRGREGLEHASSAAERAAAAGDRLGELCARLDEGIKRAHLEPEEETIDQLAALAELALPVFEEAGDEFALHVAYCALGQVSNLHGKQDALVVAYERAIGHARRVGFPNPFLIGWCGAGRLLGTTPVSELLAWQDEQDDRERRNPWFRAQRAEALAMLGRFTEARTLVDELQADLAERGAGLTLALTSVENVLEVELLAGDPAAAVTAGEDGCRGYEELGLLGLLSTGAGLLARAYYALGWIEEAEAWAGRASELGASDDVVAQIHWRPVKAKVLARRGEHAEAERLAREAVALSEGTDVLNMQGEAYADLAEVLAVADRPNDSAEALEQALARYERKENVVMAERTRARLVEVRRSKTGAGRA